MDQFEISHWNIMESSNYTVHVGTVPGDKVPQYLVFHKTYEVLEYAHNNIWLIPQALKEMESHVGKMHDEDEPEKEEKGLYN